MGLLGNVFSLGIYLLIASIAAFQRPRTILLMMLVVCLNGCFLVEQPFGSLFEYYPRWRDFMLVLRRFGGPHTVAYLNLFLLYPLQRKQCWQVASSKHSPKEVEIIVGSNLGDVQGLEVIVDTKRKSKNCKLWNLNHESVQILSFSCAIKLCFNIVYAIHSVWRKQILSPGALLLLRFTVVLGICCITVDLHRSGT